MNMKKVQNFLNIQEKAEILNKLSQGVPVKILTKQYNIAKSTITRIKQKEGDLKKFISNTESGPGERKTLRPPKLPKMEEALFSWFMQKRFDNETVSVETLCKKAKQFHDEIKERPGEFNASNGWVKNFKKRHGIKFLRTAGERFSVSETDDPILLKLTPELIYKIEESDDDNADEIMEDVVDKIEVDDAIKSFDICLEWAKQNEVSIKDLKVLQKLRNKAVTESKECTTETSLIRTPISV